MRDQPPSDGFLFFPLRSTHPPGGIQEALVGGGQQLSLRGEIKEFMLGAVKVNGGRVLNDLGGEVIATYCWMNGVYWAGHDAVRHPQAEYHPEQRAHARLCILLRRRQTSNTTST